METITKSASETQKLGQEVGASLKGGEVLALEGDLGSGKTTFIQGLAKVLGIDRIISPTFILMRSYPKARLYHLDLYRLEKNIEAEFNNLGVKEFLGKAPNIVVLEWAEKVKELLPQNTIWIKFEVVDDNSRKITISR